MLTQRSTAVRILCCVSCHIRSCSWSKPPIIGRAVPPSGMLEGSDGLDSHVAQPSGVLKHLFQSQTVTRGPAVPNQR